MNVLLGIAAILLGIVVLIFQYKNKRNKLNFFEPKNNQVQPTKLVDQSVIDIKALTRISFRRRMLSYYYSIIVPLGRGASAKVIAYYTIFIVATGLINDYFFYLELWLVYPVLLLAITILGISLLRRLALKDFNDNFPDALNTMSSAITAGESLMHSIIYVGEQMVNSSIGREFKHMGERLQIGESPSVVLNRACIRFPYPEFIFFAITLRANIERGGQLRDIIQQLNRVMFNARSLDKKKKSMTAEARMSAKIVFAIPFLFLIFMRFFSPENFNFIFMDERGRMILYYVLASEAVGMFIISALMRGIK